MKENQSPSTEHNPQPRILGNFSLQKAQSEWGRSFGDFKSLFETSLDTPAGPITSYTHMLGLTPDELNFVAFDDSKGVRQENLEKLLSHGEVAIVIKHHSPHPDSDHKEELKFQSTHIQLMVKVDGGVFTINNPRGYCNGGFGDSSYPSIFIRAVYPKELTEEQKKTYQDNIRTWAVLINTVSQFPPNYNGSDPLKCITKENILEFGKAVIAATLGDEEARAWLKEPEQMLYCAELAFVSLNLGFYFPLNKKNLGDDFELLKTALEGKEFLSNHENPHIRLVDLVMSPESLEGIDQVVPLSEDSGIFWEGLAVKPFSSADIIAEYIKRVVPRLELGEAKGAVIQVEVFKKIRPELYNVLNLSSTSLRIEFDSLLDQTEAIVKTAFANYKEFRASLDPVLEKLRNFSLKHGMAYIPPHCFLLRAFDSISKSHNEGLLGWEYIGHGFDQSLFE